MTNEVTRLRKDISASRGDFPVIPSEELCQRDMEMIRRVRMSLYTTLERWDREPLVQAVSSAEMLVEDNGLAMYRRDFEAAQRQATRAEIAMHLAGLVGSFPNATKLDGEVYGRLLVADVGAAEPSIGAIEAATRKLRRTSKFVPTIAELLAALEEAETAIRNSLLALDMLPAALTNARQELDRRRVVDAQEREARKLEIRRRLDDGKSVDHCEPALVAEVQLEAEDAADA